MKPVHPEKHRNASNTNNLQLREDYCTGQNFNLHFLGKYMIKC